MRRRGHVLVAVVLTLGAWWAIDQWYLALDYRLLFLGLGEAVLASALPDFIEPGRSSDHRGGFHSWRALVASLILAAMGLYLMPRDPLLYHPAFFLPWGYAAHLLADALSPSGLPP